MTKYAFTVLLVVLFSPTFSQSTLEEYLTNNWVSAAEIFSNGDTVQYTGDQLTLGKGGELSGEMLALKLDGNWEYLSQENQVKLRFKIFDTTDSVNLDILQQGDQILTLSETSGSRTRKVIYVEEGSGLAFETREKSLDEMMTELNNKPADPDLGYTPVGEVLNRFDYNKVIETYEGGSGSSTYQGIAYLLNVDDAKRVVIIEGEDALPDEWFVVNEKEIDNTIIYECESYFIYKRGEKIEKTTKAEFEFGNTWLLSTQESKQLEYIAE